MSGASIISHLSIEEELWSCRCDKNRISQCIDNLVINAIQAMPEGGALSFTVRNALEVPSHLGGDAYIVMKIEDTGLGIPSSLLDKIFDPFFSTKEEGNGLGLATVFSIIKNHDGWIDVQSESGVGTSFTLYLPASRSEKPFRNDRIIDYQAGTGHILVLDDKEYILEILKTMIETMGYATILTEKSSEAIRIIQKDYRADRMIKACILDQTLPGDLHGHEVAMKIHEIAPDLPLIASSGYAESDVMTNPEKYHFAGCISKPFDSRRLSNILHDNIKETAAEIG